MTLPLDPRMRLPLAEGRLRDPRIAKGHLLRRVVERAMARGERPDLAAALRGLRDPRIKDVYAEPDPRRVPVRAASDPRLRTVSRSKPLLVGCGGTTVTLSAEFLASNSGVGMNQYAGDPLTYPSDQGWVFGGYALPLMDHPRNQIYWVGHTPSWTAPLAFHVESTSSSTIYLRECSTWRMYFPANDVFWDGRGNVSGFPSVHPQDTSFFAYPAAATWSASGAFTTGYFAYTDSPDGGLHFPILGPARKGTRWSPTWSWSDAGWRVTAVPTSAFSTTRNGKAIWAYYSDATVLDLKEEMGYYVMVCLAVLSETPPTPGNDCRTSSCDGCAESYTFVGPGSPKTFDPSHTLLVAFFCPNPDFGSADIWPDPLRLDDAAVLLEPMMKGRKGTVSLCPIEWYGVPSTALVPAQDNTPDTVMIYVMWNGRADMLPSRITTRYPNDGKYRSTSDTYATPLFYEEGTRNGISAFGVEMTLFAYVGIFLDAAAKAKGTSDETIYKDNARVLLSSVEAYYSGEVLNTDGRRNTTFRSPGCSEGQWDVSGVCTDVPFRDIHATDPQPVVVYTAPVMFYDRPSDPGSAPGDMEQVNRGFHTRTITPTDAFDFTHATSKNGPYTIFQQDIDYPPQFDLRGLFSSSPGTASYGRLTADVDPAYIGALDYRVSFSGGADVMAADSDGLLYAIYLGVLGSQ